MSYIISMANLQSLIKNYLDYLEVERGRSRKTRENYKHYLERFSGWAKIEKPTEIDADLIREYRLFLNRTEDKFGRRLKKSRRIIILSPCGIFCGIWPSAT